MGCKPRRASRRLRCRNGGGWHDSTLKLPHATLLQLRLQSKASYTLRSHSTQELISRIQTPLKIGACEDVSLHTWLHAACLRVSGEILKSPMAAAARDSIISLHKRESTLFTVSNIEILSRCFQARAATCGRAQETISGDKICTLATVSLSRLAFDPARPVQLNY